METKQISAPAAEPIAKVISLTDFTNKQLFVGIDVHKIRWQAAVLCEGILLSNSSIAACADDLITYLHKHYPGASFSCVYECGAFGYDLCRSLWAGGMECILVNPADIPGTDKERRSKTDPVDARRMVKALASGLLEGVHVPSEKEQKQRSLIRFRKKLWADLVRAKNRLKSELKFQGIVVPQKYDNPHWSKNFIKWIETIAQKDLWLKDTLLLMLEEVQSLRLLLLKTEMKLRELMKQENLKKNSELLRTIPGIGPLTAALFLLEIGDVKRFKSFDALNRFVGLCPDSDSSGEDVKHIGISVRKHKSLRSQLVESAWMAVRKDPAMLEEYQRLCKRMKGHKAIIRIARKLLRRMRAVLLSGKVYVKGITGDLKASQIKAPELPAPKAKGRPRKSSVAPVGGAFINGYTALPQQV